MIDFNWYVYRNIDVRSSFPLIVNFLFLLKIRWLLSPPESATVPKVLNIDLLSGTWQYSKPRRLNDFNLLNHTNQQLINGLV